MVVDRSPSPSPRTAGAEGQSAPLRARYRRILAFAARVLAQTWWFEIALPRIGLARVAESSRERRMRTLAQRFHVLAVELGGLMIKVGQFLSSRLDVLPPEITTELAGLQDEVPAVPIDQIRALAEAELGVPLARAFASFDEVPLAAASLGQAHRARLSAQDAADTGFSEVVVKVQRPGIDQVVATDLAALRRVAGWLRRIRFVADRVNAPALVEEFAQTSLEEIDYIHEASAAERFAEAFRDDPRVDAPLVAWERTTRRVLTLSDVTAIKINDVDALRAAGIDPADVAHVFAEVMFDQVFTHGFVHADPHPGNIFVTPHEDQVPESADPAEDGVSSRSARSTAGRRWRLTFIDFGMMAEVPEGIRHGLRTLFIAAASRDGKGMVAAAQEIGVLMPSAENRELERALTALFARFGGMGFAELRDVDPREFQGFAEEFGDTMRSLPVQLPEGLLLLIRAVSLTSGMCSGLDPQFNIWESIEPYATRLLADESGNIVQDLAGQAVANAATLWRLPKRIDDIITRVDEGSVTFDTSRIERRLDRIDGLIRRGVSALLFAALLIGGALVLTANPPLGVVLMSVSVLPLLHTLFAGLFRRGPR
ncbi:ABC1 kinase family protein [Microbacterium azadirachtae]|uniref:ABC1 kinase family protein n=1 Tax=Microbacterium azadirachtae TaxID=582680 RepID=UPI00088E5E4B|nr:AarF/UbiB family protein [Microbacterium azadirachtae]UXW86177.1 AarF/UbiB family protein [Microbacterium azadirachtae]SDL61221.1 Predicted unusual protein kinase regulating ubiquinone biosynthesis, AarF/ABC1/UbiB family [Microbacterium azadirachtae]SEF90122.1 Predicted unusual protein kinase regulating ubiquinone biosynthesis, AarF/ABC1/UbiB family [Microbacterium azadirachtae]SEF92038.1 Predicted unusual protein kinase regulating ubiquinone biosynthesis, AarF/ABC1/UbiB family [Microbacteri